MELIAVVKDTGFNGDGTVHLTLMLSQIDGRATSVEVDIANPNTASGFKTALKQAARDAAQAVWGTVITNANTLLIGE